MLPLALAAGGLAAVSLPPWGLWVAAFPGLGLLAWCLQGEPLGRRTRIGGLFAAGLFLPGLWWAVDFHAVGYVALVVLQSCFVVAACAAVPPARWAGVVALPGALVLAEAARGTVPFGGLPMSGVALGQAAGPLAPAARLGGGLLVAGLAVAAGAALAAAAGRRGRAAAVVAVAVVAVAGIGAAAPGGRPVGPGERPSPWLSVALVQGGGERGLRAVESDAGDVLDAHLAVSRRLSPPLDLVLWPENAVDVATLEGSPVAADLAAIARRAGATLVAGVTEDTAGDRFHNVAVAWSPDGRVTDRYVKVRRVPFGEYVPLRSVLDPVVDLRLLPRDAVAGRGPGVLSTPAGTLGVAVSYEVFFGERARAAAAAGGRILLVPTNASSYDTSQVPTQEVAAARLQAWATGRWVLQAAPTGYSAIVDHRGRVLERSVLGRAELVTGRAQLRTGRTPYVVAGDGPVVLAALALVAGAWFAHRRRPEVATP